MNYFGLIGEYKDPKKSKVVIIQIPFENSVSYGKGTSKGPESILKASKEIELFDEELECEPFEVGIETTKPIKGNWKETINKSKELTLKKLKEGKFPIIIGGEHSISLGPIKAAKEFYSDIGVLQIDAHADLRDEFEGNKQSHACIMRRILEEKIPAVQIGIRSISKEEHNVLQKLNTTIFKGFSKEMTPQILSKLPKNIYITFDMDALDPSIIPSVGTPEPGGLLWYETLTLLKTLFKKKNVIGIDLTEFSPIENLTHPNILMAKLLYKIISYKFYS